MRFSELIKQFARRDRFWEVCCGADRELQSVSVVEGTEKIYHPGVLYFGLFAQMKEPYPSQLILIGTEEDAAFLRGRYEGSRMCLAVVHTDYFASVFNQSREQVEYTFQIDQQERIMSLYRVLPDFAAHEIAMAYCVPTEHPERFPSAESIQQSLQRKLPYSYVMNMHLGLLVVADIKALRHDKILLSLIPEECRIRIGISNEIMYESRVRTAYTEAQEALEIGRRIRPDDQVYPFAELGIYNLLRDAASRNELDRYLSPNLIKLQEQDRQTGTHLFETLRVYLLENGNIKNTAEKLYLHRNTVIYRMGKIRQITNLDLDDARIRFLLLVSYAAIQVKEKFA
ncbi:MAG: helix-turn-helix domain-containing protein [Eubacterium sp.]|nr:helix-turn-helix domain-containing protein [Eubacterium sp.]